VKLPHSLGYHPTPQMPVLAGCEPRFAPIPTPWMKQQPAQVVRPLYWWALELRRRGDILLGVHFDSRQLIASVTVRLASCRVVEVVRRNDHKLQLPHDLPTLLA